ncbi:hypothetical protein CRP227_gp45 [Roseobacter phage CRP-227]|jgi:hypothetical protein|uniref:Holin n=1 Tax=Roseobacter phage CRP-227 TaxID=3072847 RepID=A0AAX3ZWT3_9CAUD|nr:hypothetical protein CRP227_gp45 [Roseobacter phage CRP-227]
MNLNPLGGIVDGLAKGLDELFTSDEEREAAKLKLATLMQQPHMLQAVANIEGAKHRSVFVAGWRPAIGWVAALGLGYQFLVLPFAGLINAYLKLPAELPQLQAEQLMTLVLSLLGLGGMRTFEKYKGAAK